MACEAAGRRLTLRACAERIEIVHDERIVAEHVRSFDRYQTIYNPWHYVPALARKPGALRNGAPFTDWSLPAALTGVRRKLQGHADGDRQFVAILNAVVEDGLETVEAACREALASHSVSADVVLTLLARTRDSVPPAPIGVPAALQLVDEPRAGCSRYNQLEPRTYNNAPIGLNFLIAAYQYEWGDVLLDPSLPIKNADAPSQPIGVG